MAQTRLMLVDDSEEFLTDIRQELEQEFEIVGSVTNGQDALDCVGRLDPTVVILDIAMPLMHGITVASHIHKSHPSIKIVFLTICEQDEYVSAAFSAGASGYVTKRQIGTDLVRAIHQVMLGNTFLSPSLKK